MPGTGNLDFATASGITTFFHVWVVLVINYFGFKHPLYRKYRLLEPGHIDDINDKIKKDPHFFEKKLAKDYDR